MIKKSIVTIFLIIAILFAFIIPCLAYEDELFEFDLPSNFANMSYQDIYMFADTTAEEGRGFLIVTEENTDMKKFQEKIKIQKLKTDGGRYQLPGPESL